MSFGKKLKAIIKEEGCTTKEFAEKIDIPVSTLTRYLYDKSDAPSSVVAKIASHIDFRKYTMWLLTGEVEEDSEQVSPKVSIQEKCGLIADDSEKQA